jgi:hypothetical protein
VNGDGGGDCGVEGGLGGGCVEFEDSDVGEGGELGDFREGARGGDDEVAAGEDGVDELQAEAGGAACY